MRLPLPKNEIRRLLELRRHEIMDTAPEPAFERIVRIAARFFAMPIAAVSFVEEFRVWRKACLGLPKGKVDTARDAAFCSHTILEKRILVVRDAWQDERFRKCSLVTGPECVRFYAGAPVRTAEGQALGALCVLDTAPREFTGEDESTLCDLAALVMDELKLRRLAGCLHAEIDGGRQARRTLTRQHRLLRRLGDSLDDRIRRRTHELTRTNDALREEIARREQTDAALQQAKEEAEKANAAKSEFLSRMSHELRTPLNAILGFGRILQGSLTEDARRDCASHVVTAGRHLLVLINEALDIARIEAGHVELSLEPVPVAEIVGEALDLIRPLAAERGTSVEFSAAGDPGYLVLADRRRFKQVLLNLLANAVKYGAGASGIEVGCQVERGGALRLTVVDDGPGLTREQAARLFIAFDRLGAEHSAIPGTGLGLALSKRLVEAMGGKIGVKTAPGRGSTFWVSLPSSGAGLPVVREIPPAGAYRAQRAPRAACTVVYIDDNPSNVRLIEHFMTACPAVRLLSAGRGEEGLEIVRKHRPDLILLDLHLPDLPGWEVLARLRTGRATRRIPVAAISADATADTVRRVMQAGARAYLTMPLNVDSLYRLLPETCRPAVPDPVQRD